MQLILNRIFRLARGEDGFTMIATMGVLFVVSLVSIAAFAAADGDVKAGATDRDRKTAYAAAEAGINDYLARLRADTDYWRKCSDLDGSGNPNNAALNLANPGAQRRWATISGSTAQYSIEVLPANGQPQCTTANPQGTFIDTNSGTFRIRATGRAFATSNKRRSIVATFRRQGFLDYVYFTDNESQNPRFYIRDANGYPSKENPRPSPLLQRDIMGWAAEECDLAWHDGRSSKLFVGNSSQSSGRYISGAWNTWNTQRCEEITFGTNDEINGPMHSNDSVQVCGTPDFGRSPADDIEVSGPGINADGTPKTGEGWRACGSGATPQVNYAGQPVTLPAKGTWRKNSPLVTLPPSNSSLKDDALPNYRFKGTTYITLNGSTMTVTGKRMTNGQTLTNKSMNVPTDGVIYVGSDTTTPACVGYDALDPIGGAEQSCGDVWVKGTYSKNVTITAENDIVIENDVTRVGDYLLGLISNNMIRVNHPVSGTCGDNLVGTSYPSGDMIIDAAILSLRNSFTVDRWWCGDTVGNLIVRGAIAQKFRGTVAVNGSSGYVKDYQYDDRLKFRSPPRFLDPVQAGWKVLTQVEQVPPSTT